MSDDRPASFDARVMQYLPGLKKLAWKYVRSPEDRQDLVTDTIMNALSNWKSFREDGGFWVWLTWCMRTVVSNRRQAAATAKGRAVSVSIDLFHCLALPAEQDSRVEIASTLQALDTITNGDLLLRGAMGESCVDLARERGCSDQRMSQIMREVRDKLGERA